MRRLGTGLGLAALAALPAFRDAVAAAVRAEEEDLWERALGVDPDDEGVEVVMVIGGRVYTPEGRGGVVMWNGSRVYVWLDGDATPRRIRGAGRS